MYAKTIAVIGLGNLLLTDEGFGVHVIQGLKKDPSIPESVAIIEAGTPGLDILNILEGFEKALILDIAELGGKPGTVYVLTIRKGEPKTTALRIASVHEIDFLSALELGWSAGLAIPTEIIIIAVEPKDRWSHGLELTPQLAQTLPRVFKEIRSQLAAMLNSKERHTQNPAKG